MAVLGCIADDFTGASDAASFLAAGGMAVRLFNGIPEGKAEIDRIKEWLRSGTPAGGDTGAALVVALKTRTQPAGQSVRDSLAALRWLRDQGASQFYVKYCSTFDSTPAGNIGPIADASMEFTGSPYTLLCPSLPVNGRTVAAGHLYVNGVPLDQSPMKDHPLNPMWDSFLPALMEPQSRWECLLLERACLSYSRETVEAGLMKKARSLGLDRFYVVPDYGNTQDGERIAALFGHLPLLTGGSGLLEPLARRLTGGSRAQETREGEYETGEGGDCGRQSGNYTRQSGDCAVQAGVFASSPALLLAGSCSPATLAQIAYFESRGGIAKKLEPALVLDHSPEEAAQSLWIFLENHRGQPVLIYSSETAEQLQATKKLAGGRPLSPLLEETVALLASRAVERGWRRLIVAGGETSGAVTRKLGLNSYDIGASVAPGVPVLIPPQFPELRIVLKSGNFGQKDFFFRALEITGDDKICEPQRGDVT